MNVSPDGIEFTQSFEGCRLDAYLDEAGIPTIGWGHIEGVELGMTWTQEQADAQFLEDMEPFESTVSNALTVEVTQPQYDALFDFSYNEGSTALLHSTLLAHINAGGDLTGLFEKWDKVREDGVLEVSAGLLRRRKAEDALYSSGDYGVQP